MMENYHSFTLRFYVYYEQYEYGNIVRVAIVQILLSLGSIFFATTLLLDLEVREKNAAPSL